MFREMRCSRAENHFALPILEKGQSLIIMIPHRACSGWQKEKMTLLKSQLFRACAREHSWDQGALRTLSGDAEQTHRCHIAGTHSH